jgi:hypothetical protein
MRLISAAIDQIANEAAEFGGGEIRLRVVNKRLVPILERRFGFDVEFEAGPETYMRRSAGAAWAWRNCRFAMKLLEKETWSGGRTYQMDVSEDEFLHFTTRDRAEEAIEAGKLSIEKARMTYAVYAVSLTFGKYLPRVQRTGLGLQEVDESEVVALRFKTDTIPYGGHVDEVSWMGDVNLIDPRVIEAGEAIALLEAVEPPVPFDPDDDFVIYTDMEHLEASMAGRFDYSDKDDPMGGEREAHEKLQRPPGGRQAGWVAGNCRFAQGEGDVWAWTNAEAEEWIERNGPLFESHGFRPEIVGSVSWRGKSKTDLDIRLNPIQKRSMEDALGSAMAMIRDMDLDEPGDPHPSSGSAPAWFIVTGFPGDASKTIEFYFAESDYPFDDGQEKVGAWMARCKFAQGDDVPVLADEPDRDYYGLEDEGGVTKGWYQETIWEAAEGLPVEEVPVRELSDENLEAADVASRDARRVEESDLEFPIVMRGDGGRSGSATCTPGPRSSRRPSARCWRARHRSPSVRSCAASWTGGGPGSSWTVTTGPSRRSCAATRRST